MTSSVQFYFKKGVDKTVVMVFNGLREGERWVLVRREVLVVDH